MCQKLAYAASLQDDDENEGDDPEFVAEGDDDEEGGANGNDYTDFSAADGRTFRDPFPDSSQLEADLDVDSPEPQEKGGDMSA